MGIVVSCHKVKVLFSEDESNNVIIAKALSVSKRALTASFKYAVELPEEMANQITHTGTIDHKHDNIAYVTFFLIDWEETDKLQASRFVFGDKE